jgi:hypothetical protein
VGFDDYVAATSTRTSATIDACHVGHASGANRLILERPDAAQWRNPERVPSGTLSLIGARGGLYTRVEVGAKRAKQGIVPLMRVSRVHSSNAGNLGHN